ncbi:aminoacyl-tRNA hydrolase [Spiroplasma platyhelix]|uniref:Peptidyl-tRNA hydrolase n=1 Tax=Spiroplasma platyhelix PALS-1 TaxID=1276218 RepID=A0A846TSR1_9MOLU|nr:aminoacyl-tRNA hydrolase [Spiroplasma platyhelix]MBE4704172.1 Peptidyl-tRNA hydrolase [Spiroplasma platyhelix PALS-1]NKE38545.1 aminoacyl-tRNA hydrolase [Spiroplasma platyhelix PALS-1]UJB29430.1 peptidyl-tRNA hydrolase [Spiroplasma platyhelix PALS-1]
MKLIVGLGNPGKKYELTRHNAGFIVLDSLSKELKVSLKQHKFDGEFVKTKYKSQDVILLKPLTFMNLSGSCVVSFMNYFKIKSEDVLIIHDEIDLPFGRIQFKNKGSAAGHNGLTDIFEKTKAKDLMRLRIGVGRNAKFSTVDWVLSNFDYQELLLINNNEKFFVDAILTWLKDDNITNLMNKFNNQQF